MSNRAGNDRFPMSGGAKTWLAWYPTFDELFSQYRHSQDGDYQHVSIHLASNGSSADGSRADHLSSEPRPHLAGCAHWSPAAENCQGHAHSLCTHSDDNLMRETIALCPLRQPGSARWADRLQQMGQECTSPLFCNNQAITTWSD